LSVDPNEAAQESRLKDIVGDSDSRPARQSHEVYRSVLGEIEAQLPTFNYILATAIVALNRMVLELRLPALVTERPIARD
jgi:hypothetical protein